MNNSPVLLESIHSTNEYAGFTMILELEQKYKLRRKEFNENFRLRIHRAISWLKKANEENEDDDIRFVSLWIAFNAIYAKELEKGKALDKVTFMKFINTICDLDKNSLLRDCIWQTLPQEIIGLLNNKYTFQPFWNFYNGHISEGAWRKSFKKENETALLAIKSNNTSDLLCVTFEHLYTLRNQIIHGGATYNSFVNRKQLKEACHILSSLIPIIIEMMMDNAETEEWGKPFYPFVKDDFVLPEKIDVAK